LIAPGVSNNAQFGEGLWCGRGSILQSRRFSPDRENIVASTGADIVV